MPEHPLHKILSRMIRASGDPHDIEITYIHRGAPGDQISIGGSDIVRVAKGSLVLSDGETQIPFHRILKVRQVSSSSLLWEKRTRVADRDPQR